MAKLLCNVAKYLISLLAIMLCITVTTTFGDDLKQKIQEPLNTSGTVTSPKCACHSDSFADIVEPLIPTVVNIYTLETENDLNIDNPPTSKPTPKEKLPMDHFNEFLQQLNVAADSDKLYSNPQSISLGSGFIVGEDGYIVTNYHVISRANEIQVKLSDSRELPAKIVGIDKKTDIALLKIETDIKLPIVKFADSAKARVGDKVISIGNPFGTLSWTVTSGIISAKSRDIDIENGIVDNFIQTDAAIHSGNSGSPLFNIYGEVIGISTALFSPSGKNIGISFATPVNTVKLIIEKLKTDGKIPRGKLGVAVQEVTKDISEALGLKTTDGALVSDVYKDSPTYKAGLKSGDVIVEYCNELVKNPRKLQVLVAETPLDKDIKLKVLRRGKLLEFGCKMINPEDCNDATLVKNDKKEDINNILIHKISFVNLNADYRQRYNLKKTLNGIIVLDIPKDEKNYGLKIGDLIVAINQEPVSHVEQLRDFYKKAKGEKKQHIIFLVQRRGANLFVTFPIE